MKKTIRIISENALVKLGAIIALTLMLVLIFPMISNAEEQEETWADYIAESYAGGNGTKETPYQIETAEQLARMAYEDTEGYFILVADIDISQYCWKTAYIESLYDLYLDGAGHKIIGLKQDSLNDCYIDNNYDAYSGFVENAEINKVIFENINIDITISGRDVDVFYASAVMNRGILNSSIIKGKLSVGISKDFEGTVKCFGIGKDVLCRDVASALDIDSYPIGESSSSDIPLKQIGAFSSTFCKACLYVGQINIGYLAGYEAIANKIDMHIGSDSEGSEAVYYTNDIICDEEVLTDEEDYYALAQSFKYGDLRSDDFLEEINTYAATPWAKDIYGIFDGCAVPIGGGEHDHVWTMSYMKEDGSEDYDKSKVVIKCSTEKCTYVDEEGDNKEFVIGLDVQDKPLSEEYNRATVNYPEDLPREITRDNEIKYYKVITGSDGKKEYREMEDAPKAWGEYCAKVIIGAENSGGGYSEKELTSDSFFITREITNKNIELDLNVFPAYTGKEQSVKDKLGVFLMKGPEPEDKEFLVEGFDFEITEDSVYKATEAGEYTIKVKGINSVTGEASISWKINPAANSFTVDPAIEGWTYGEEPSVPSAEAAFGEVTYSYGSSVDGDFTSEQPTDAGTYYMVAEVAADNNFSGITSEPVEFKIAQKDVIVTPVSSQMKYVGQEDPEFLYDVDGLLEGDTLSGKLGRQEGETEGTYEFNIGTLKDDRGNYNVMLSDDEDIPFFQIIFQSLAGISATIDKDTFDKAGQTAQITVTFDPEDASDKEVKYESTNTSVAKVDATGKVTAVADGTSTIVVTSNDSGYTAEIKVTVRIMGEKIDGEGTISGDGKILIDEDGTEYNIANKVDKNDLKSGMMVADKASGGKYKITGLTKKGGKIVNATVAFVKPYNSKTKVVTIKPSVKIGGVTFKITSIAANAFKGNVNITKLTIGKNITTIGKNACNDATKLKNIIFKSTKVKKIGANAFKNIYKKAKFKLTKKRFKKYRKMVKKAKAPKKAKYTK